VPGVLLDLRDVLLRVNVELFADVCLDPLDMLVSGTGMSKSSSWNSGGS